MCSSWSWRSLWPECSLWTRISYWTWIANLTSNFSLSSTTLRYQKKANFLHLRILHFFFFGPFFFSTNYNHSVHFYMTKKLKVSLLKEIVILSKRMENRNFVVGDNVICIIVSLVSFFRDYCSNWTVWVFSGCSHLQNFWKMHSFFLYWSSFSCLDDRRIQNPVKHLRCSVLENTSS